MNVPQFHVVECDRTSSLRVRSEGPSADNKASYFNLVKPITLKKGDSIQLDSAIISVKGANSDSIEFTGRNNNNYADNFALLEVGYYLNHNGTNSCGVPFIENSALGSGRKTIYNDNLFQGSRINNAYGTAIFKRYFNGAGAVIPPDDSYVIEDTNCSINPYQQVDGTKYGKIKGTYLGYKRQQTGVSTFPKCELETFGIPLSVKKGFLNPTTIADRLTLQMQKTLPVKSEDPEYNIVKVPSYRKYHTSYEPIAGQDSPDEQIVPYH